MALWVQPCALWMVKGALLQIVFASVSRRHVHIGTILQEMGMVPGLIQV